MRSALKILIAQINTQVGAILTNQQKIIDIIIAHQNDHHLIVFPELALTGYPPEDLLFRKEFHEAIVESLKVIQSITKNCYVVLGHPSIDSECCFNSMSVFYQAHRIKEYHKQNIPNYGVFDEERYFTKGPKAPCILEINQQKIGFCICEDLWQEGPVEDLINSNVSLIISINASPFDYDKYFRREELLKNHALNGITMVYVNQVCGQDELLFDGQSLVMDTAGVICARLPAFEESVTTVEINLEKNQVIGPIAPLLGIDALIYKALVYGTKDYVQKNKFPGVILGLSGGIDSSLTLTIAVDALGAENVHAVLMPSRYTAAMSNEDALLQVKKLNVSHSLIHIEPIYTSITSTLESIFASHEPDTTEENIQARIRGLLLMAISNKTGKMVLTTSNKSETAIGYCTLYGDMAGGFAVLKDVLKTQVYALAQYRNTLSAAIPPRVISRAPSAELKANQTDQDTLPDYHILDAIIVSYMENNLSPDEIIHEGFAAEIVHKVINMIKHNEYKRRQSPPGIKISPLSFGKDWRFPITNGFNPNLK